jgi:uncharacterized protein with ParB-like and HNH nuclease domain
MQSELKSLSKIFSESLFRIPDYQRGYSWQEKHLRDFWTDIEQLDHEKSHYTGVLTLEPVSPAKFARWDDDRWIIEAKKYVPLYVVDGQQRLTTAIVLLQTILEKTAESDLNYTTPAEIKKKFIFESRDNGVSRSYIFGYEKDNPSYDFLKEEIFGEQSENHNTSEQTIYTRNLQFAKEFFSERIKSLSTRELEVVYTKLTQNLLFNIFFIEPALDVFVTFETMNNRGKPLSHLELLKNRLIYLSTKFDVDENEKAHLRTTINESWKTVYHYLGKRQFRVLDDDRFLLTHFLTYFGSELPRDETDDDDVAADFSIRRFMHDDHYKDYLLEVIFSPKRLHKGAEDPLTVHQLHEYALDIKKAVELYYRASNPVDSDFDGPVKVRLEQINRLDNYWGFLLSVCAVRLVDDKEVQLSLLTAVERFLFLQKFRPNKFHELRLEQFALKLRSGDLQPQEITRKIQSACDEFVASTEFIDALQRIGKEQGYYGWNPLRYFLFEYEQHLRARSKTHRVALNWDDFSREDFDSDHKSVEHIYPQTGSAPYWRERFGKFSVKERNILKNSVGNLLPVSKPKNSALSNKPFPQKKGSSTEQVGYAYGCLSEVEVAQEQDWTPLSIAKRGVRLLSFMEKRWTVPLGSSEDKLRALGLGFVFAREGLSLDAIKEAPSSEASKRES